MNDIELLLSLLVVVAATAWLARSLAIPYPIFLVGAGFAIAAVPGLPDLEVEPEVILLVFVPPLVHAAAWQASVPKLREQAGEIAWLSFGAVALTTAAVALVAHAFAPEMGWAAAIALGAIVSPTDAVAARAVFSRVGAPERLGALVEGEALVNDGTGLALYAVAVGAVVSGGVAFGEAALEFFAVGIGGVAIGLAVAWVVRWWRHKVEDGLIEITITLLTPYLCFIPAEELGVSGILAAVASGLYLSYHAPRDFTPAVRLQAYGFWSVLVFLMESVLFILIGLQTPEVLDAIGDSESTGTLIAAALAVGGTVVAVRLLAVLAVVRRFSLRERLVIGWSGMRGAISLAAALSIPFTIDAGGPFPERELLIFLTLAAIAVTLIGQGLTLPLLVRALAVRDDEPHSGRAKALARFQTVQEALARVSELSYEREVPADLVERARSMYTERARQLTGECRLGVPEDPESSAAAWTALRRELLAIERGALTDLRDEGRVPFSVVLEVQHDLDLEEARLERVTVPS